MSGRGLDGVDDGPADSLPPDQLRQWRIQRIGWGVVALILLLSLGGVMGHGPWSASSVSSGDLQVEYSRVVRHGARSELQLSIDAAQVDDDSLAVWVDQRFLDSIELEQAFPEASSMVTADQRVIFEFDAAAGTDGVVTFQFVPRGLRPHRVRVGIVDGPSVAFTQIVLP